MPEGRGQGVLRGVGGCSKRRWKKTSHITQRRNTQPASIHLANSCLSNALSGDATILGSRTVSKRASTEHGSDTVLHSEGATEVSLTGSLAVTSSRHGAGDCPSFHKLFWAFKLTYLCEFWFIPRHPTPIRGLIHAYFRNVLTARPTVSRVQESSLETGTLRASEPPSRRESQRRASSSFVSNDDILTVTSDPKSASPAEHPFPSQSGAPAF